MITAYATIAGTSADIDPTATVDIAPQRTQAAALELANQMPHSLRAPLNEPGRDEKIARLVTDRLGANWNHVYGVLILRDPAGQYFAAIGDIIGVDTMTVQFANDRRLPVGRVVAVGLR
ncbi:MAG: hypothetical protein DI630_13285 [Gordonia sp. (in: high G+C Gram-positive bacteria)]|nr:MAG: hypothetical protein DI630_13285 [Gordonia sp. (in: high G+C Gram-positive bacteria)]